MHLDSARAGLKPQSLRGRLSFRSSALASILRPYYRYIPLVAFLGLAATLIESVGVGVLIPLIGLLMSKSLPPDLPWPIVEISRIGGILSEGSHPLVLVALVIGLIGAKCAIHALNNLLIARVHAAINRDIMDAIARHTLRIEYPTLVGGAANRAFNLFSRSSWLVFEAVRAGLLIIQSGASAMVFTFILLWLDWRLSVVAASGALVIAFALARIEAVQRRLSLQATAGDEDLLKKSREITDGGRIIRVFGQESNEETRFAIISRRSFQDYRALNQVSGLVTPIFDFLIACVFSGLLFTAYNLAIPVEQVTAFLLLLIRAQPQAGIISAARASLATYAGPVAEFEALMRGPTETGPADSPSPIVAIDRPIVFEGVEFVYPDGTQSLTSVSFSIEPGSLTALLGKSGAGKTTLVNLILGLHRPTKGSIRHGDKALADINRAAWLKRVALAGQDTGLFSGTIAENIAYGVPRATEAEILEAACAAGAAQFISEMPDKLDAQVGDRGSNLSGGQQQRIALARALLKRPDLLILDEATSAVDAITEHEIMKLLRERRWFRTAIVISHRPSTIAACEAAIVLDSGRVIEAGALRETAYHRVMGGHER